MCRIVAYIGEEIRLEDLNLKAKVVSSAELVCDRCLRIFEKELKSKFKNNVPHKTVTNNHINFSL